MKANQFSRLLQRLAKGAAADERPRRATVTAITNRNTAGEIEATRVDGTKIYVHAASVYDVAVGDEIYVQKQRMGLAQARWMVSGFHKTSGGSYIPPVRPESLATVLDNMLTDDSGTHLLDDSSTVLMQD